MKVHTENIRIPVGGEESDGTVYIPTGVGPFPSVLVIHGRGGDKSSYADFAEIAAAEGFFVLIFTLRERGNILSEGYRNVIAAFDFLYNDKRVDKKSVIVWGTSVGGYLASLLTRERPVSGLILSAPALYKDDWWSVPIDSLGDAPVAYRKNGVYIGDHALEAIVTYTGSFFLITREFDEMCPAVVSDAYWKMSTHVRLKDRYEIQGSGHRLTEEKHKTESTKTVINWLKDIFPEKS